METPSTTIPRRDLELLLIGLSPSSGVDSRGLNGITRLQKLLFLLEKEEGLEREGSAFGFTAYKAGPYSSALYDDLELLENLGLLEGEVTAEATAAERAEIDALSFDELMGEGAPKGPGQEAPFADSYAERQFRLTEDGKKHVEQLLAKGDYKPFVEKIRRVKSRYGRHSLSDLIYYVYTKYPEMATESEIKDKIMSRRR